MQVPMYVELGLTRARRPVRVRVGEKRKKGDPALHIIFTLQQRDYQGTIDLPAPCVQVKGIAANISNILTAHRKTRRNLFCLITGSLNSRYEERV